MAGLPLLANAPAGWLVEFPLGANPMLFELVEEEIKSEDGMVEVPERPGLGITVRQAFLDRYAMAK